ncbi:MAG: DNA polymerase III subunit alpha [Gemmatimonadales bacterium]
MPPGEADKLTKLIPSGPAFSMTVAEAGEKIDELKAMLKENEAYRRVFTYASRIEGLSRHASVHAAGVVIAPGPLADYVPVCTAPTKGAGAAANGEDSIICQYEMGALEKVGMLKMDILGLKTLTVIHDAVQMIVAKTGAPLDIDALPFDDPEVYALLRRGRTAGVFQFESPLATETLRAMKCDRFDDLVASNALLRPGPLDAGMHTVFIKRKLGHEPVTYPHPSLVEVLEPTYGVITYQEQVMRIANVIAGFTLAEADVLRKAVGKKDAELIKKELGKFITRGTALGHERGLLDELAAQIETFGRYGFNKSHSVAYSVLSYQTAWLKTHHPAEFMAALLSSEIGSTDKVVQYINEARELGLEVLPPDVHESGFKFTVVGDRRIRFGLGAVRNVGAGAIESIIAARENGRFRSLADFARRIDRAALQQAGLRVADRGGRRRLARAVIGRSSSPRSTSALGEAQLLAQELEAGQESLFGEVVKTTPVEPTLPDIPPWTEADRLAKEKEILGFFISGHPLERYRPLVELFGTRTTATIGELERAPGGGGRGADRREAADLQEDREGVRPGDRGGLPRHRRGDRLPRGLGQAQPGDPGRRGDAAERGLLGPGPGRGPGAVHRRGGAAAGGAGERRAAGDRHPVGRPGGPCPGVDPDPGPDLHGPPRARAALYSVVRRERHGRAPPLPAPAGGTARGNPSRPAGTSSAATPFPSSARGNAGWRPATPSSSRSPSPSSRNRSTN